MQFPLQELHSHKSNSFPHHCRQPEPAAGNRRHDLRQYLLDGYLVQGLVEPFQRGGDGGDLEQAAVALVMDLRIGEIIKMHVKLRGEETLHAQLGAQAQVLDDGAERVLGLQVPDAVDRLVKQRLQLIAQLRVAEQVLHIIRFRRFGEKHTAGARGASPRNRAGTRGTGRLAAIRICPNDLRSAAAHQPPEP